MARNAIRWTFDNLTDDNRDWLAALPAGPMIVDELIEICHGTPFDEDAYVFDDLDALRAMHAARRPLCLFGHTHVQVGHYLSRDQFGLATADEQRPLTIPLGRSEPLSGQSGIGGTAARRRSARRLRHRRHGGARDDDLSRRVSDREGAGAHHGRRACLTSSRSDWRSDASGFQLQIQLSVLAACFRVSRSSAAYASCAAREPSTQPITIADQQHRGMKMKCAAVGMPISI